MSSASGSPSSSRSHSPTWSSIKSDFEPLERPDVPADAKAEEFCLDEDEYFACKWLRKYSIKAATKILTRNDTKQRLRVVVVGEPGVGKTSLLLKAFESDYEHHKEDLPRTLSYAYTGSDTEVQAPFMFISELDASEKFASLRASQLKSADVVVFCFDVSDWRSFRRLQKWLEVAGDCGKVLVGLKADRRSKLKKYYHELVPIRHAVALAKHLSCPYVELSPRDDYSDKCKQVFRHRAMDAWLRTQLQEEDFKEDPASDAEEAADDEDADRERNSIKVVAVGKPTSGCTSLLMSYATSTFPEDYVPTVFDNYQTQIMVDDRVLTLQLWDTGGSEDYDRLRPLCYPGTDVCLMCFSLADRDSFQHIKNRFWPELQQFAPDARRILVGTKLDLQDERTVSAEEAQLLAREIGAVSYVETSAKTQKNVKMLFTEKVVEAFKHK